MRRIKKVACEACGKTDCPGWNEGDPFHEYRGKGKWTLGCHCENCTKARVESGGFAGALADHLNPPPATNVVAEEPLHGLASDIEFLIQLHEKIRQIPVMHGLDGFDLDCLADVVRRLREAANATP